MWHRSKPIGFRSINHHLHLTAHNLYIIYGGPILSLNPCWVFWSNRTGLFKNWGFRFILVWEGLQSCSPERRPAWLTELYYQHAANQKKPINWTNHFIHIRDTLCYLKLGLEKTNKLVDEQWEEVFPPVQVLLWIPETCQRLSLQDRWSKPCMHRLSDFIYIHIHNFMLGFAKIIYCHI